MMPKFSLNIALQSTEGHLRIIFNSVVHQEAQTTNLCLWKELTEAKLSPSGEMKSIFMC